MCTDGHGPVLSLMVAEELASGWDGDVFPLEPVDAVSVLTVCDNFIDGLRVDQGPAHRDADHQPAGARHRRSRPDHLFRTGRRMA